MEQSNVFTVTQLNNQIKRLLEGHYRFVWVKGEISNFRIPASGHCYFTLKDEHSQIRAVLFRVQQRALRFAPEDGLQVICQGRISVYEPRGEYQLIIDVMELLGFGQLQLAFEQLKKKLEAEGLFDPQRKKPLPACPQRIALVTSGTGAAIRDILKVLQRAPYPLSVTLYPVRVQGAGAAAEIAEAIDVINRLADAYLWDVMIVGRGGGSLEDLWSFNEETVARAMACSRVPIISAVGHEIDWTIADLVADSRAPTPTAAAEWIVTRLSQIQQGLTDHQARLIRFVQQRLEPLRRVLDFLHRRLLDPRRRLADLRLLVDDRFSRLHLAWNRRIDRARGDIDRQHQSLSFYHPASRIRDGRQRLRQCTKELIWRQRLAVQQCRAQLRQNLVRLQNLNPLAVLERV
ncbi:MAG TPA: exodeoxyribonuclease VII large subunit [Syntrophobacteraceae bacterium]|nr:exodeoxyribonuclease VII large subunit [Syntrophobacteraceae bacterium]